MKSVVCTKYGPPEVLELQELDEPVCKNNEVLIKIYATTVTAGDCELRRFEMSALLWIPAKLGFGMRGPRNKILGQELAGEIESVGKDVKILKQGEQVFARTGFNMGAYSEYICMPEDGIIAPKPKNLSYGEAATVPLGGIEALHFLKKANIKRGQKVLINGASGSIGTIAVQIAKCYGAEVTGVCSTKNMDMVLSIGADHVIDYTKEDFTKNNELYDVIFDIPGKSPFKSSIKALKPRGYYLLSNPGISDMLGRMFSKKGRKVITGAATGNVNDLMFLKELVETGKIRPVIDRSYTLDEMVDAHRYVENGHKKGNVVINVRNPE